MRLRRITALVFVPILSAPVWAQPPDQVEVSPWRQRPVEPGAAPAADPLTNDAGCGTVEPVIVSAADGAIHVHSVRLAPARGINTRIRLRNDGAGAQHVIVIYSDTTGKEVTRITQQLRPGSVADFALAPGSLPAGTEFSGSAHITSDGNVARLSSWAAICTVP